MKISGTQLAEDIIIGLQDIPRPNRFLAAILIGENTQSFGFVQKKKDIADRLEIDFRIYKLPASTNDELRKEVHQIAHHTTCGGVLVQLPLPEYLNRHYIMNVIPREKDVDVLSERALGALYADRAPVVPPAVAATRDILTSQNFDLTGKHVAIIGSGLLVGKPITVWMMHQNVHQVSVINEGGDMKTLRTADLVISGAGKAGIITPDMLQEGAGVIDFGYSIKDGKLRGDFDAEAPGLDRMSFYTPTPGGTGPVVIAELFQNFYTLNNTE